ncbi:MAG: hypothetical protein PHH11_11030 [Methylomonas sp.]|nr:hypothetical protein [Methylomonas sp.]
MKTRLISMNRRGSRFEIEVIAALQQEAKKKAKQQFPNTDVIMAKQK